VSVLNRKLVGYVNAEHAHIMIVDPAHADSVVDAMARRLERPFGEGDLGACDAYDHGVIVPTVFGDGRYPVYLEEDSTGNQRLVIDL